MLAAKKGLLHNKKVMKQVINYFNSQPEGAFEKMNKHSHMAAIALVAAHRLIAKALQHHTAALGNSSCIIQDNCGSCTCAVSQSGISV